jgi:hypothetical protein
MVQIWIPTILIEIHRRFSQSNINRDSEVYTAIWLRAEQPRIRGLISGEAKGSFVFSETSTTISRPIQPLNGCWGLFSCLHLTIPLHLESSFRMRGFIPPLSHINLWRVQRKFYLHLHTNFWDITSHYVGYYVTLRHDRLLLHPY